jgi:hypothetical protein
LAALHKGEAVLSTLNGDAQLYQQMQRDGRWSEIKRTENYAAGTPVARGSANSGRSPQTVTVDRINSVDYVSVSQLQDILEIELPRTAKAGAAITEQNLTRTNWRQSYAI